MCTIMKSTVSIGCLTLNNRVAMPAIGVNLSTYGGGVSDDIIAFYQARAAGGVGLIISEITRITDGAGAGEPYQLAARGEHDVPDLQRLTDAVHKYGTKIFLQLQHPGAMATPAVTGVQSVAPSAQVMNAEEACQGGITLGEATKIAAVLEEAGADAINVSCLSEGCIEPATYMQGWKKYMPKAILELTDANHPVYTIEAEKSSSVPGGLLTGGGCLLHRYRMDIGIQDMDLIYYDSPTRYYSWEPACATVKVNSSIDDPYGEIPLIEVLGAAWAKCDNFVQGMSVIYRYPQDKTSEIMQYLFTGRYDQSLLGIKTQLYETK